MFQMFRLVYSGFYRVPCSDAKFLVTSVHKVDRKFTWNVQPKKCKTKKFVLLNVHDRNNMVLV